MKKLFLIALTLLTPFIVSAETVILAPISSNTTWTAANGPFLVGLPITIQSGATLTIEAGTVVKFTDQSAGIEVQSGGTLNAQGTTGSPIYFTSFTDDVGGDSNGDGTATTPTNRQWGRIVNFGALTLENTQVRYGGYIAGGLSLRAGSTATLTGATIHDMGSDGISQIGGALTATGSTISANGKGFDQSGGSATFTSSTFANNTQGFEVQGGSTSLTLTNNTFTSNNVLGSLVSFGTFNHTGNTATGGSLDGFQIGGNISGVRTLTESDLPYIVNGVLTVQTGGQLTLEAGATLKFRDTDSGLEILSGGILNGNGITAKPITFTALTGTTDRHWKRILNRGSLTLNHATISHGGFTAGGLTTTAGSFTTLDHVTLSQMGSDGIAQGGGTTTITHSIINNNGKAIDITGGSLSINQSAISNNQTGIDNGTLASIDAKNNWWGATTGPFHSSLNPSGEGNPVSNNVNFSPFMTSLDQYNATKTYRVAVVLAETYDVNHDTDPITARPCKIKEEKLYANGYDKAYYEDLYFCVADYYREVSKGTVNFEFTIFDNDGEWYKITNPVKTELWYGQNTAVNSEDRGPELITDVTILVGENNLNGYDFVDIVHSGSSEQFTVIENEIASVAVIPTGGQKPISGYKAVIAEKDPLGIFVHELGHRIGGQIAPLNTFVPDLTDFGPNIAGVNLFGVWDVMATGSTVASGTNPTYFSSWTQQFLGWLYEDVYSKQSYGTYWIDALEQKKYGESIFRYNLSNDITPLAEEYYIIETRNRTIGIWDSGLPFASPGNLVLYYVNKNSKSKYGYDIDNLQNVDKWTITIPKGSSAATGNGILPSSGDIYRDFDHLVSIKTIGERTINGKYEIRAEISPISFSDVSTGLSGSVLRTKNTLTLLPPNVLNAPGFNDGALMEIALKKAETAKTLFYSLLSLLALLFIATLTTFILSQFLKVPSWVRYVLILLFLSNCIFAYFAGYDYRNKIFKYMSYTSCGAQKAEEEWGIIARTSEKCTRLRAPSSSDISPDLDLHAITPDGRHIGVNYTTGEYENQIAGSIVSGDNQGIHEWIFVPDSETVRYYVSAHDNEAFLAANPQVTGTTDTFDIYARTIDPEAGIFTSTTLTNQTIESTEERVFEVSESAGNPVMTATHTLTVTADNLRIPLGAAMPEFTYTLSGFEEGDSAESSTTGAAVCTTNATATSPIGTYSVTCAKGTLSSSEYAFTSFVEGIFTIAPTLTVSAEHVTIPQGADIPTLTATISGFINGDTAETATTGIPDCTTTATNTSSAGNYPITCTIGTLASNAYIITTYVDGILTILPQLTVTAHDKASVEGQPIPPLTAALSGFINGDTQETSTTGAPVCTTPATPTSVPGAYPITCEQGTLNSSAYAFTTFVDGTLTVEPAIVIRPLTVTADNKSIVHGASFPSFTYSLSGFVNGDTAASSTTGSALCTTTATPDSPVGTYPITCTEGTLTSATYTFSDFVAGTLAITDGTPPELQTIFDELLKDVVLSAVDTVDEQPALSHSGNIIALTDSAGNATIIHLTKYKDSATKLKLTYNSITRNGVTVTVPQTTIMYDWSLSSSGALKGIDSKVTVAGVEKYMFTYSKNKHQTKIKVKNENSHTTTTRNGFVTPVVTTDGNGVVVAY
jgi:M6 family metalloprotease-like protein